jgi:nanoRNase/pAp phosphatase (c-di-AMP/oligoRNAs hydrolase)
MRLVTRGDLDGVTAAVLLTSMEPVTEIELIHPQDITDGKFEIRDGDLMANLPYHPKAALWFDHHELTASNLRPPAGFRGRHQIAPSVARVIYDYYASEKLGRFAHLVGETDRFDSAQLTREDVLEPKGVVLLGFTIDSRTGLGRFKDYFKELVEWLKTMPVEQVLEQPEVRRRVAAITEQNAAFLALLRAHSRQSGNVVLTDFRDTEQAPVGNRFLVYTLFPETNISLRAQWGPGKKFVAMTLGHNIFNRTSQANCGQICSDYGGGGHRGAGACTLEPETADAKIAEIVARLRREG